MSKTENAGQGEWVKKTNLDSRKLSPSKARLVA